MSGFSQSIASSQFLRNQKEMGSKEDVALIVYMVDLYNVGTYNVDTGFKSHKLAGQFRHRSFPYYDQLTSIYAKDRAIGKNAQTAVDIVEEIDAKDVATTNNLEEGNGYHGCEDDVSMNEMDVSATQLQPLKPNHDGALPPRKCFKKMLQESAQKLYSGLCEVEGLT
ncbi:hypothetical protein Goklo_004404 [Gossypium klotzschianum]|uniref:Uncharacterized protein n=1 Tax=Gossypium klotzschianum TaxID=34286 RepID=A0A7J8VNJ9_9ROSI|nr:hypothetical protein [Gossypium klotzschianum]